MQSDEASNMRLGVISPPPPLAAEIMQLQVGGGEANPFTMGLLPLLVYINKLPGGHS